VSWLALDCTLPERFLPSQGPSNFYNIDFNEPDDETEPTATSDSLPPSAAPTLA
jgi:hypothetical protein